MSDSRFGRAHLRDGQKSAAFRLFFGLEAFPHPCRPILKPGRGDASSL